MRISDWSSDVCSSDLQDLRRLGVQGQGPFDDIKCRVFRQFHQRLGTRLEAVHARGEAAARLLRERTSELLLPPGGDLVDQAPRRRLALVVAVEVLQLHAVEALRRLS